ncbi:MAG: tetratricopeptide repeat protein, partial [Planctomycetota bacterium]
MSARVNVKFVVLLSVVLVAAMGGVVWAAMVVVMKSGDDHAARAMEFEAAGDFEQAENSWARAVNHDPARVDWLEGWRRSMESIDYPTASEYNQSFGQFRTVLRALADAKGTDESAYEEYLGSVLLELRNSALTRDRFEYLDDETDRILSRSDWNDPSAEARLRRHRGQFGATVLTAGADLDDDQLELITEDLELALEADPSDVDSMASLFTLKRQLAEAADRNNRDEERERFARESNRLAADFARANPESIRAQAIEIIAEVSQEFQRIGRAQLFGRDQIAAQRVVLDRYTDRVLELNERFKAAGADQTDSDTAAILMQITRQIVREQPMDLVLAIWDHAAATRPDDVDVMRQRATFLKLLQRYPEAIDAFGEIAAMERPPVSARGVLLVQAQQRVNWQIADCAIEQWRLLPPGSASRDGWLADAREAWVAASEDLPQDSPELTLLNAKLAFADKDYNSADRLIRAYNTRTLESDPTAVRLAAEIAGELNNAGEQRRLLMRAVALDRNDLRALLPLVEINTRLRNYGEAERLLAMAVDMLPDNEALRDRLDTIRALAGSTEIEDPVQAALIEAQRSIDAGDRGAAIETLERAAADNPEPDSARLQITMASLLLQAGEFERAAEIVAQGLEIEPESAMLRQLRRQAEIGDNAELAEAAIDELDLPEAARWLRKHRVRLAANDMDGATEAIDRAVEIDGDDPAVLRAAFDHALRIGDLDRGREIAEAGGRQDIDGAGGLAMQARVHIADGNLAEAERAATAAVERGSQNASTLRLLAQVQFDRGNSTAALDNFERAREIRPDDIGLLTSYLRALGTLGRNTEALEIARDAVDIARTNSGFVEAWLYFEALAGNKQLALDERSAIAQRRPEDAENTAAMISLAIDLGEFDEARRLLDDARGARDSLRLVALDARWHAERNDPNGAVEQYTSFLVSDAPEAATAAPYIAFGSFLLNRGQIDRGLTTLRQGRQFQNPENPVVDSTLGQQLFRLGRYQQAIEVFRSIIDGEAAGTPIAAESGKRLIECYTRIGDWESAQAEVDA